MWLMTPRGFYSAVQKWEDEKDGLVTVRARVKEDLENLADLLPNAVPYSTDNDVPKAKAKTTTTTTKGKGKGKGKGKKTDSHGWSVHSDYEWRIRVPKDDWAKAVAAMSSEITYGNFKDEVKRVQGPERASVYASVWGDLLKLERPGRYGSYAGAYNYTPTKYLGSVGDHVWDTWKKRDGVVTSLEPLRVLYVGDEKATQPSLPKDLVLYDAAKAAGKQPGTPLFEAASPKPGDVCVCGHERADHMDPLTELEPFAVCEVCQCAEFELLAVDVEPVEESEPFVPEWSRSLARSVAKELPVLSEIPIPESPTTTTKSAGLLTAGERVFYNGQYRRVTALHVSPHDIVLELTNGRGFVELRLNNAAQVAVKEPKAGFRRKEHVQR